MTEWIKFSNRIPDHEQLCIFCTKPKSEKHPDVHRVLQFMGTFFDYKGDYWIHPGTFYYDENYQEGFFSAFTSKKFRCVDIDYWMPAPADPEEYR